MNPGLGRIAETKVTPTTEILLTNRFPASKTDFSESP